MAQSITCIFSDMSMGITIGAMDCMVSKVCYSGNVFIPEIF